MTYDSPEAITEAVRMLKEANETLNRERRNEGGLSYSAEARFHDCVGRVLALRLPPKGEGR